jgi:tetratricopeptide (TPR) repeat protein
MQQLSKIENMREAQKYIDQGRLTAAMSIYQKIVDGDPLDLAAISMLGDLHVKAGRVTDAVEHYLRISENYLKNGSAVSAAYILKKVIKLDATNPQALMHLGELAFQEKKMDLAHDHFIEAGAGFWNKGNIAAAIQVNKRALEIKPDSRLAKVALALIEGEKQESEPPAPQKRVTSELPPVSQQWPTGELTPVSELPDIMISISDGLDEVCSPGMFSSSQLQTESPSIAPHVQTTGALDSSDSSARQETWSQADEDAIIEQIATAEFLVACGQIDRALAQLRERLHDRPDHIQIREKLKDIYLRSGMIDRASEECVNIAGIYAARGDNTRATDYVKRARLLISPEPYTSPVELLARNLNNAEETPKPSLGWSPGLAQPVTLM